MVPPQTTTIYSTLINKSTQKACGCAITFRSSASYVSAVPSEDARITWANYDRYKPTFNLGDRQHLAMRRECCGIYAAPADSPAAVWFYRMEGTDWDRTAEALAAARSRYQEKYRHGPKRKDSRYSKRQKRCVQPRDEGQEGLLALALPPLAPTPPTSHPDSTSIVARHHSPHPPPHPPLPHPPHPPGQEGLLALGPPPLTSHVTA